MNENELCKDLNVTLPQDIDAYKKAGEFDKALMAIDRMLKSDIRDEHLRNSLMLQKEIIYRLDKNYVVTFDDGLKMIQKLIPDFTKEELQSYMDEKRFSWIYKNHEIYFLDRFNECLERYEDYNCRLKGYVKKEVSETDRNRLIHRIKEVKHLEERIKIKASIRVKDEVFEKGMKVLVHLPIPRLCDHHKDIVIESYIGDNAIIADENSKFRTICFNEEMKENHPFEVTYSYTSFYDYIDLDNKKATENILNEYLGEELPHIVFTDHLRKLADSITDGLDDDLSKAKAIYDYLTLNCNYSYQPEYFVRDNIPEYVTTYFRGDCGFFALTFITLCRIVGIPAYFESGMAVYDDECGSHDWARFYVEPFGWLYADVSYGIGSRMMNDEESRQYYFGHLDQQRMVSNLGYLPVFDIPKKYYSIDPYDNQRGEIETEDRGLRAEDVIRETGRIK